jgi:hypothetical protein
VKTLPVGQIRSYAGQYRFQNEWPEQAEHIVLKVKFFYSKNANSRALEDRRDGWVKVG